MQTLSGAYLVKAVALRMDESSTPTGDQLNAQLVCPICDFEYVHFEPPTFHATDSYTSPTGERGSWIEIPCWCEHEHAWSIVIAFHKGHSFLRTQPREFNVEADLPCARNAA